MNDNTINADVTMGGATGTLLSGRYRVVKQLGQGGMGSVWLAEDTTLDNRHVAIKMLPSVLLSNKRAYQQIKSEALLSLKLLHSNIAPIRSFEENGGNPFLVEDYIHGKNLDDCLAEWGVLTDEEVISLLKPIAEALDYAHREKIVHRDIKPANIMVREDGVPFVLDFGIAREMQETMTRVTGKLSSGTLMYMSPEQLKGVPPAPEQDVYSFAAMVYECLCGHPPFCRGQIEYQIINEQPGPLPHDTPLARMIMRALSKSPSERPATCLELLLGVDVGGGSNGESRQESQKKSVESQGVADPELELVKIRIDIARRSAEQEYKRVCQHCSKNPELAKCKDLADKIFNGVRDLPTPTVPESANSVYQAMSTAASQLKTLIDNEECDRREMLDACSLEKAIASQLVKRADECRAHEFASASYAEGLSSLKDGQKLIAEGAGHKALVALERSKAKFEESLAQAKEPYVKFLIAAASEYESSGMVDDSIGYVNQVLELDPKCKVAHELRMRLKERLLERVVIRATVDGREVEGAIVRGRGMMRGKGLATPVLVSDWKKLFSGERGTITYDSQGVEFAGQFQLDQINPFSGKHFLKVSLVPVPSMIGLIKFCLQDIKRLGLRLIFLAAFLLLVTVVINLVKRYYLGWTEPLLSIPWFVLVGGIACLLSTVRNFIVDELDKVLFGSGPGELVDGSEFSNT